MKKSTKTILTGFGITFVGIALAFFPQTNSASFFIVGFGLAEIGNAHRYYKMESNDDNNNPKKKQ